MYQITESQLATLDAIMREELADAELETKLKERKEVRRASLLAVMEAAGFDNKALAGVTIRTTTDVTINEPEVLAWAMQDDNYMHAAPVLSLKKAALGSVLALVKDDPKRVGFFEVDKTGAKRAAREGSYVGFPIVGQTEERVIAITLKDVVIGDALAAKFTVMPDELPEFVEAL
jgi:hypothetical protein